MWIQHHKIYFRSLAQTGRAWSACVGPAVGVENAYEASLWFQPTRQERVLKKRGYWRLTRCLGFLPAEGGPLSLLLNNSWARQIDFGSLIKGAKSKLFKLLKFPNVVIMYCCASQNLVMSHVYPGEVNFYERNFILLKEWERDYVCVFWWY